MRWRQRSPRGKHALKKRRGRRSVLALTVVVIAVLCAYPGLARAPDSPSSAEALHISSGLRIAVDNGREITLWVRVAKGEGYASIARRVTGKSTRSDDIRARNDAKRLHPGDWIDVPLELLSDGFRSLVLRNLFPKDDHDGADWVHLARSGPLPTYDEGLWQVAEWFGIGGSTFSDLMRANGLSSPELRANQKIRIPADLLHPAFKARMRSADGSLYSWPPCICRGLVVGSRARKKRALRRVRRSPRTRPATNWLSFAARSSCSPGAPISTHAWLRSMPLEAKA